MSRVSNRTLVFYFLAAICIVLLILSSSGRLAPVEGVCTRVARPFLVAFNGLGRQINNVFATARDLATLRVRNQQLQTQADTLIIDNLRLKEVESENERLRELLRFAQLNPTYDFRGGQVIARVISGGISNYLSTIAIDLGAEHGIQPGMPVVTERGLVGRIYKVGPVSATVLLITDPSSGVQALVKRNRAVGVVTGQAGAQPVMDFVPQDADISVGDEIITSGLGGNFPKNLVIGQVVKVHQRDYEMFQQATIRPTVNFERLEFVLVITNFKPLPGQPDELESVG
ncbi:MAG: rod shape-determining protein MreC [Chloroflexi bacterium HGW-Chloroflexi-1]|nr:MAG: rod shape-determining protein MreC [Chloroflexi bacterium HGW-Chloroflexi-1]